MTDAKESRFTQVDSGLGDGDTDSVDDHGDDPDDRVREDDVAADRGKARGRTQSIPHRVLHDSPKAERSEVQFMLGDDDQERLRELEGLANNTFDEKVFKTDVYLAALRAGLSSRDESFLGEMKTIGYGFTDE